MKIIDNYLDKKDFNKLKDIFISANFPYYFNEYVSKDKEITGHFYFTHTLYDNNFSNSQFVNYINPLLNKLNAFALRRIKINCYPKTENLITHDKHQDYPIKHKGAIYFLNTCNGGTYIEDKFISSIENRIILFDPSIFHASTNCTNEQARFTININYK